MPLSQELIDKAASVLLEWSNEATFEMQRLLRERLKRKDFESSLSQSINFEGTQATESGIVAKWDLDDYYIYVDLGVKGIINKSAKGKETKTYTSAEFPQGFQFKNYGTPPQMINALQSYIARKGIQVRMFKDQDAAEVLADSFEMAETMAFFIKRKGTDGTRFYSDVFNDKGFKRLTDKLERAIGGEFEVKIIAQLKE